MRYYCYSYAVRDPPPYKIKQEIEEIITQVIFINMIIINIYKLSFL